MRSSGAEADGALAATWWLSTRWLRRRWVGMIPVLLVTAVGTAGACIAVSTADRTASAYGDYLQRAAVGDLVINPAVSTREIDEVIRTLPGVERVTSDTAFATTLDDARPRPRREVAETGFDLLVRGSSDGKYIDMDRPQVQTGRMPTGRNEAAITSGAVETLGLEVGDTVSLAFWQPGISDNAGGAFLQDRDFGSEVIEPIGVEELEVVGVVTLPGQVLPDDLLPRADLIVSPELAAIYDCLPSIPATGGTIAEVRSALLPAGCALNYRYYSLSFVDGAAGVKPALDAFNGRSAQLNEVMAGLSDFAGAGIAPPAHFPVAAESSLEERRVDRAVQPVVAALLVLGVAAAVVTLTLAGLAMARELRRTHTDLQQWRELAVGRGARTIVVGLPGVGAVLLGALVGAAVAALIAPGAVGQVGVVATEHPETLGWPVVGTAALVGWLAVSVIVVLAIRSTRRIAASADTSSMRLARAIPVTIGSPAVAEGVRAAVGPRSAFPVIAGSALIGGSLVAAVVFGSSLVTLVATPASYGWPWDVAALTGLGYGDLDLAGAHALLDDDEDVDGWATFGLLEGVVLDDRPMVGLLALQSTSGLDLPVLEGRIPDDVDEIAVGASTAADLGLQVGDDVEFGGGPRTPVTVTGIVVFPSLGPFLADRVGAGTGVLLPERLVRDTFHREGLGDPSELATFVGVDLRPDADGAVARISQELGKLDVAGLPAFTYQAPVRPPSWST